MFQIGQFYLLDDALRLGLDGGGGWPGPSPPIKCGEAPPSRQFGPPAWSPLKFPEKIEYVLQWL